MKNVFRSVLATISDCCRLWTSILGGLTVVWIIFVAVSITVNAGPGGIMDYSDRDLDSLRQKAISAGLNLQISPDRQDAVFVDRDEVHDVATGGRTVPLDMIPGWMTTEEYAVGGLRWADMNDDGWLDLVTVHYVGGYPPRPEETRIWYNQGGTLESTAGWVSTDTVWSTDVSVGDLDNNSYPDIVVVNDGNNVIYFQDETGVSTTPSWTSSESLFSLMSAIGDVTGSGFPDFSVVNQGTYSDPYKPNHLYGNTTGIPGNSAYWISGDVAQNMACALGDFDEDAILIHSNEFTGDGVVTAFTLNPIPIHSVTSVLIDGFPTTDYTVHLRNGWILFATVPANGSAITVNMEISDDLDMAVAVDHGNAKVYLDTGTTLESTPSFTVSGTGDRREKGVSWIDVDIDGDLDLFVGGRDVPMLLYENNGGILSATASWSSVETEPSCSDMDWIDMDLDGDPDLAVSSTGDSDFDLLWVYENIDGTLETSPSWVIPWSAVSSMCNAVAWGDMNGDGYPDLAAGFAGAEIRVYLNTGPPPTPTPGSCIHDGDVNLDGTVSSGDAQLTFMIALGVYTPSYDEACAADCNGDEEVTSGDAQLVFGTALGYSACVDPVF